MNCCVQIYIVSFVLCFVHFTLGRLKGFSDSGETVREYCVNTEAFEAQCLKNEVIVMTSAVYGRMRMGRCLEDEGRLSAFGNDPKYLGCSIDILHLLDNKCSGLNRCEVRGTFDNDLKQLKPCHAALKLYLEASYKCVAVIEEDRSCTVSVSSTAQHIMRSSSTKLSCGTKSQPWMLEAPAGQQINVSLLDFGTRARETGNQLVDNCLQYGYIVDKAAKKNVSICGLVNERRKLVYTSASNIIEIILQNSIDFEEIAHKVLLGLSAVGCLDVLPPDEAWLRRNNNEAVVGCYSSRQTWHLRCVDNQWIGVIGNCTREVDINRSTFDKPFPAVDYQIVIIVLIASGALAICLTIICCGTVCLKRHYVSAARKYKEKTEDSYKKFSSTDKQMLQHPF